MKFNKLVRDKIPDIIKKNGDVPITHIASEKEFETKLHEKLREEIDEFLKEENEDELADIFEVIDEICRYHGFSKKNIEKIQKKKAEYRCSFTKRIILDETK